VCEQGLDETRYYMRAEIGRDDANPQTARRVAIVAMLRPAGTHRRFESLAKAAVLGEKRLRAYVFPMTPAKEHIAMRLREVRFDFQRSPKTCFRFLQVAEFLKQRA
jgi:hypothetical protein